MWVEFQMDFRLSSTIAYGYLDTWMQQSLNYLKKIDEIYKKFHTYVLITISL